MGLFLVAFVTALVVTLTVVHVSKGRGAASLDGDFSGPQKFHARPVPRIGGVGIVVGMTAAMLASYWLVPQAAETGNLLMVCSLPAFVAGLTEDFTKKVSPRRRLFFTLVSAAAAFFILGAAIDRTTIPGVDWFVGFAAGSFVLTVIAVAGVANAINIIDGFNGLASMCGMLILGSLSYVAFQAGDAALGTLCLAGVGALMGFFIWNFPAGLIFLGDGGAYFLGFFIAEIAILLLQRNPDVSPLFPLLVCIYPIFETLFSIYRRRFLRAVPPSMPDGIHLHSLIYRRIMRWAVGNREAKALTRRNSMTSPYLWLLCMSSVLPSLVLWDNTPALAGCILLFVFVYVAMYWRIVRFRTPRWMIVRGK